MNKLPDLRWPETRNRSCQWPPFETGRSSAWLRSKMTVWRRIRRSSKLKEARCPPSPERRPLCWWDPPHSFEAVSSMGTICWPTSRESSHPWDSSPTSLSRHSSRSTPSPPSEFDPGSSEWPPAACWIFQAPEHHSEAQIARWETSKMKNWFSRLTSRFYSLYEPYILNFVLHF